ncbi:trypsin-like peptidase domain-containing protein [Mesorhizobium sp. GbtcB19]|uniref:trypsin-like peptidase domain-containing protein n=1 Tax=Mesorhizobium sp. GbtcB19 TaxID=2824764 RepID=UPI001C2FD086|nr:trypsin-like peptidase domain-containing protein [Mesorhizobium sp. GbtcB19]
MAIQLSQDDFDGLVAILTRQVDWLSVRNRIDFMLDVLAGSPRKFDLMGQLDLDGSPRRTAVHTIERLMTFGQDQPGREALGVLVNKLIAGLGGGDDVDRLRDMLARYPFATKPVAARDVAGWRGRDSNEAIAEKIIGENTLRDISFLEVLLDLSRAVVRVRGPQTGTGFLIAEDLLITNQHVIENAEMAKQCVFEFNYQLDRTGRSMEVQTARAQSGGLFHMSPIAEMNATRESLDYAIVQLTDVPSTARHLEIKPATVARDGRVTIIQHPGGSYKKISMQNNFVEYADDLVVQYTTSTEPGSSGSPVLNDNFEVVALHHAGGQLAEPATKRRFLRNEGVRMSAILDDLRLNAAAIYKRLGT